MNKKLLLILVIPSIVISGLIAAYCIYIQQTSSNLNTSDEHLIGGQKDEHGCLIPAGYSWCEIKQKCLRTWEEKCEAAVSDETLDWQVYRNDKYGFELKFPPTWDGYKVTSQDSAALSNVGFSFLGTHQPFTIFQIIILKKDQLDSLQRIPAWKTLGQTESVVMVCDGCCSEDGNYTGGGQFDDFQIARCKEGSQIIKTFKLL
jgi:hypothetical protein